MKKNQMKAMILAGGIVSSCLFVSCDKADDKMEKGSEKRTISFENVVAVKDFVESGFFKGEGDEKVKEPIILPGSSVSFKFHAGKTQALMFATMYGASKDWFFASQQPGIKLYDEQGKAMTGDVSSYVKLWDNGTKNDQTGAVESKPVMEVNGVNAAQLMKLSLNYNESSSEFTLTISNISKGTKHETPFSPGVWAVSNYNGKKLLAEMPFFTPGKVSNPEITAIAQMGKIDKMLAKLKANTGIMTGISPALVVVYSGTKNPIYELGKKDNGMGLKELSQSGNMEKIMNSLKKTAGVKRVYVAGNTLVAPGQKIMTGFEAMKGDKIAYATMFGFSNDWFYANEKEISALYKGNVTLQTALLDSGTGVDQYPGAGNKQALFGGTPEQESMPISIVGKKFPVPEVNQVLKITIE